MKNINSFTIVKVFIIGIIVLYLFCVSFEKSQHIDNLDYNVTINEDGSIRVVETWDIYVNHTNTLFRNFDYDGSRQYGYIVDVSVIDLEEKKVLANSYQEEYHVPTGYYYALELEEDDKFEIAWGTGMEKKSGKKKYQIAYTVTDVISHYEDCQELYWKLLSEENAIPAKSVTGTISLPRNVSDIDNLKVWGHGPLNGKISIVSKDTVKFSLEDLTPYNMLEIRVITKDKMINVQDQYRIKDYELLPIAMNKEMQWADETRSNIESARKGLLIFAVIYLIILGYNVIKMIQAYKILKHKKIKEKVNKIEYFRDIPRENNSTPGEAAYLQYFDKSAFDTKKYQSNMVAGTILNLCLKKHILIRGEDKKIFVKLLTNGEDLKFDELKIFNLLKKCKGDKEEFEISELKQYAKANYYTYSETINQFVNSARNSLYNLKLVDKNEQKQYNLAQNATTIFGILKFLICCIIVLFMLGFIPIMNAVYIKLFGISYQNDFIKLVLTFAPLIAVILVKLKVLSKIKGKIAVLTQKGSQEKEEWNALINYMKDFSNFDEKGVPDLILWEKYLVYATTFGIADQVINQMKAKYPEVFVEEYWNEEKAQYEIIRFVSRSSNTGRSSISSIVSTVNTAYGTSIKELASRSSSSSGGFSSGGRWWRPVAVEWVADNIKSAYNTNVKNIFTLNN